MTYRLCVMRIGMGVWTKAVDCRFESDSGKIELEDGTDAITELSFVFTVS
jgi:hypothetical protein